VDGGSGGSIGTTAAGQFWSSKPAAEVRGHGHTGLLFKFLVSVHKADQGLGWKC